MDEATRISLEIRRVATLAKLEIAEQAPESKGFAVLLLVYGYGPHCEFSNSVGRNSQLRLRNCLGFSQDYLLVSMQKHIKKIHIRQRSS